MKRTDDEGALAGPAGVPAVLAHTPQLAALWDYWSSKLHGRAILPRPEFVPYEIPSLLSILTLIERTPARRHRFRVVGTGVVEAYGFDPTGRHFDEVLPAPRVAVAVAHADAALEHGRPVFSETDYVSPAGADWRASRLIIPLSDAAGALTMLLVGNVLQSRLELARRFGDGALTLHDHVVERL